MNTGEVKQSILTELEMFNTPQVETETEEEETELDVPLFNMPFKGDPKRAIKFQRQLKAERMRRCLSSPENFLRRRGLK